MKVSGAVCPLDQVMDSILTAEGTTMTGSPFVVTLDTS